MGNAVVLKRQPNSLHGEPRDVGGSFGSVGMGVPFEGPIIPLELSVGTHHSRRLVSTKELSEMWGMPESTLRYWRSAEMGPPYVKLGGRIKYDLADVESYVRANKRTPSVRAHGG